MVMTNFNNMNQIIAIILYLGIYFFDIILYYWEHNFLGFFILIIITARIYKLRLAGVNLNITARVYKLRLVEANFLSC